MDIEILEKKRVRGKKEDSYWKHRNPLKSMTLVLKTILTVFVIRTRLAIVQQDAHH